MPRITLFRIRPLPAVWQRRFSSNAGRVRVRLGPVRVTGREEVGMQTRSFAKDIQAIRVALRQLQRAFDRLTPQLEAASPSPIGPPRRKLHLTPARRAALKLQGQYMGYMRTLKPMQKAKVRAIRDRKGIRAAIAAAKRLRH
jgi:hypothetical protein